MASTSYSSSSSTKSAGAGGSFGCISKEGLTNGLSSFSLIRPLTDQTWKSFKIQPNDPPAPADLVEEEEEYEVETILDSRKRGRYIEYLVKWKGYSDAENSWEPRRNVRHAEEEVENFHKRYPNKPKPTSSNRGIIITSNRTILDSFKPMFELTTPSWGP